MARERDRDGHAFVGGVIIATDVLVDPIWEDYRELAVAYGFRACSLVDAYFAQAASCSFAMYYPNPRPLLDEEARLVEVAANIAGIAIEHHRTLEALRRSEERTRAILRDTGLDVRPGPQWRVR